jgi:long-chain acyl-CoA synthetase
MKNRKPHQKNLNLSSKIDAINDLLSSSRAMKLPESAFDFVKRTLRFSSRLLTGKLFLQQAVGDLRFVVHGLAPATEFHVKTLEKLGIPVLETYGTTSSAGMLSCNEFASPHFNTIGNPLAHVKFRLGDQSTLEYFLSHPIFEKNRVWEETGDVAQMTPFGIVITGRKRHLFVTLGGAIVSPVRLEKLLKEFEFIEQACVIGDKMPYLSALVVLNQEAYADYKKETQTLPRNVTIKKFKILEKPFSEKNGEKLSNGEINRIKIQQSRKLEIESLYQ